MKRFLLLLAIAVITNSTAKAQKEKAEWYVQQYGELAIQEMLRSGVPASIKLAQGILESQSGESELAKKANNHFGIKCKPEWTGGKSYHDDDEKGECFRVYPSVQASYKDHSDFLRSRAHYGFLFLLNPLDYEAWAYGLKKAGYATAPNYPQRIIKIIRDYQLDRFSQLALDRRNSNNSADSAAYAVSTGNTALPSGMNSEKSTIKNGAVFSTTIRPTITATEPNAEEEPTVSVKETEKTKTPVTSGYPSGVFLINQCKVVYASEGTPLLVLANKYNITLSKLMDYNDLADIDILNRDQLIFLEKKQKKGVEDFHLVQEGETLYSIAQKEGIRLENILQYNNNTPSMTPVKGSKIYLKPITSNSNTSQKK